MSKFSKRLAIFGASVAVIAGLVASMAGAAVNGVTPSTNDINKTNGWANVEQVSKGVGTTDLQFVSTRAFVSCFEYRTDGDETQASGGANYNSLVTDGLYPYTCVNNNSTTLTIPADEYVEVRMVFGAEGDERFDWTRFDVDLAPAPTCTTVATSKGPMTAAVVNPTTPYTGSLPLDDCQIGVYFDQAGSVTDADIFGATHYGVFADNGAVVNVTESEIHDIGNIPFNGAQNGRAVFYANGATGTVSGNEIYEYQKNGVHAFGLNTSVKVLNNVITGRGPIDTIAQNGVVIHGGARGQIIGNTITRHSYTPTDDIGTGVLLYEAGGVSASKSGISFIKKDNMISGNETDIFNYGKGGKFTG